MFGSESSMSSAADLGRSGAEPRADQTGDEGYVNGFDQRAKSCGLAA